MSHHGLVQADLQSAIKDNNYNETKRILNYHGLKFDKNWNGYDLLIQAVLFKNINIVKLLLDHGCRVEQKSVNNIVTPLHCAVEFNELEIAKLLLEHKADINSQDKNSQTPLHIAVQRQYYKMIELLMLYHPNLCIKNKDTHTPLHLAFLIEFDCTIVNLLLSAHQGALENSTNKYGLSHFLICCSTDNVKLVENFLQKGVNVNQPVKNNSTMWQGYTPLHIAADFHKVDVIKLLSKYKADINARQLHGLTPLVLACQHNFSAYGKMIDNIFNNLKENENYDYKRAWKQMLKESKHVEVVQLLLQEGADVNAEDKQGNLVMFHGGGVDGGQRIRKYMKKKKTELNLKNFGAISKWILDEFMNNGRDVLKILLNQKIDLNIVNSRNRCSMLHIFAPMGKAVSDECLYICRLFLDRGANVDAVNISGDTPLCFASIKGSTALMKLLLKYGANPNFTVSKTLMTPLHLVCNHNSSFFSILSKLEKLNLPVHDMGIEILKNSHWEEIEILIDKGANLNARDHLGRTPLFYSVEIDEARSLKQLLKAGSNVNIQDNQGMTPLFVALKGFNFIAVGLLLDYGADINITNNQNMSVLEFLFLLQNEFVQQYVTNLCSRFTLWLSAKECMDTFKLLEMHIKKLELIGSFVSSDNLLYCSVLRQAFENSTDELFVQAFNSDLKLHQFQDLSDEFVLLFKEELTRMKMTKIDNYTTLYDLITKNSREMVKHVRNESLRDYLGDRRLRSQFSHFSFALNLRFREGNARFKLIEPAKKMLRTHIKVNIPDLCYDKILIYLTNEELEKCAL